MQNNEHGPITLSAILSATLCTRHACIYFLLSLHIIELLSLRVGIHCDSIIVGTKLLFSLKSMMLHSQTRRCNQ